MRRLLIRSGALGDCIVALPVMEWLRADYTEVLVPSAIVPLVQFADRVGSIVGSGLGRVGLGDDTPAMLRNYLASFDEIVSWYGANLQEFRAELSSINPNVVFHEALPGPACTVHVVDFLAEQVGAPAGLHPRIKLTPPAPRGTIVIHPFSGSDRKNWPLERFRALADQLAIKVEWLTGPDEELEGAHRFDNLLDLATWIAGARAYVGNDSGTTHLAAACGLPVIAIFGPASPDIWVPRGNVRVLRGRELAEATVEDALALARAAASA